MTMAPPDRTPPFTPQDKFATGGATQPTVSQTNPDGSPIEGQEVGSILDWLAGDLLFAQPPGFGQTAGLLFDPREPTVAQLQEMLDNDGKARSLEQIMSQPIIKAGWHIEPGAGNPDSTIAQWVEETLRKASDDGGMSTPMETVIAQKTSAFAMRQSYHEKVWKQDDNGAMVYDKIAWRPQDTCTLFRHHGTGDLIGFTQWKWDEPVYVSILLPYASVYIHGQQRDPVKGISSLQVTYRNYLIKEKMRFLWGVYLETLSLPRSILLCSSEQFAKKAAEAVAGLRSAGVAGLPAEWVKEIHQLTVGSSAAGEYQRAIAYLDSDSALSLLAGFTDLPARATGGFGGTPTGSYALSASQEEFFLDMLKGYAVELSTHVTQSIVSDLVRYNFGMKVGIPQFVIDPLQEKDTQTAFDLFQQLAIAPQVNTADDFLNQLTLQVAETLGMDTTEVEASITTMVAQNAQAATMAQQQAEATLEKTKQPPPTPVQNQPPATTQPPAQTQGGQ
jgi:hypothetical protein